MNPGKSRYGLSEEEKKLWARVTENITRLESSRVAMPRYHKPVRSARRADSGYSHHPVRPLVPGLMENSITLRDADYNWQQKLRRGRARPEGRLDLHGMTRDEAFQALNCYLESAQKGGKRVILVVTGKGGRKSGGIRTAGVLKTSVPQWLSREPLAGRLTSFHYARKEHGGEGALYVVLKRERNQGK